MKFNFKKISAIASSILMVGMSMGVATAASYPAPFVSGSSANVAIVYGTGSGVSSLDLIQAGNIQTNLQSKLGTGATTSSATVSGEAISLDTSSTRIWLNTSLNTAKSTLTKTDLPTVLADTTFSGNVDAKLTQTIKLISGANAGSDNSGKVIFAKQPKSSNDPAFGISLGSTVATGLYNASVTMKAVNFTHADSEGETITLFGRDFVVSTATDTTDLVLFSSSKEVMLSLGGTEPSSATVNIGGADYVIALVTGSGTTSATVSVNGESKQITAGASKKVGGIDVAVKSVTESAAINTITADILVGSEKITLSNGATVTKGSDDTPVDGTTAYIVGGTGACTEIAVTVIKPDSSNDAILEGQSFTDPVFGSFKVDFAGMSSLENDTTRDTITVENSGVDTMSVTFTEADGNTATIDFAHNQSGMTHLADDSNNSIFVYEMANLTEDDYVVLGNEDYGHLLQVTQLYNDTSTDYTKDKVKLQDVMSGTTYDAVFTSECMSSSTSCGTITIDGKQYAVTRLQTGDDGWVQFKYPTGDSADSNTTIVYPTIETKGGALVEFYQPLQLNLSSENRASSGTGKGQPNSITLKFPDGDGYTPVTLTRNEIDSSAWNFSTTPSENLWTNATEGAYSYTLITVGKLKYNLTARGVTNVTTLYLTDPTGTANLNETGLIIFEGKDANTEYHAVVVGLEGNSAGTSTNGLGVSSLMFTQYDKYGYYTTGMASNTDITKYADWYGTIGTTDDSTASQETATLSIPTAQSYAQIYLGEVASVISGGASGSAALGDILVKDSEVSSVSTKNLIVVGGSCINSAAASLVGGSYCGAGWTTATNVGSGQFLIKGYATSSITSSMALLVAGYEAADTVNAAKYLTTQTVDTSKAYIGTSSTSATLQTTSA